MNWLLLRGLAREQQHWGEFPKQLAEKLAASKVLCLDLPGAGTACQRPSPCSIPEIVEDVRYRWLSHQDGHTWGVLGLSLGGMVALDWCRRYPEDFQHLVLINTSAVGLCPIWKRARPSALKQLLKIAFLPIEKREHAIFDLTVAMHLERREDQAREWIKIYRQHPVRHRTVLRQLLAAARFRFQAPTETSCLVLSSRLDQLADPSCSAGLAERLQAPFMQHALAGHDLPLDDPEWVLNRIQSFIQK